jgi:TctA family transporter
MAVIGDLLSGFGAVLEPQNLLLAALGVTLGTLVGVLPGIGPALTIALLLPLTFNFSDPTGAFMMFAGIYGQSRLTLGLTQLDNGIDIVIVAVGLFAVGEALHTAAKLRRRGQEELLHPDAEDPRGGARWLTRRDFKRSWKPWLRGAAVGFPVGAMPAGGAEVPTFLSHSVEKRLTKHPEEFGKGAIEGVAGPEAANNASFSGTLVPLLTLGIPTSAGILMFGTLGVYSISNSVTEVLIMYAIGGPGFFLRRADFPIAPVILGVILGPLMEAQFRRTLIVSDGALSRPGEPPTLDRPARAGRPGRLPALPTHPPQPPARAAGHRRPAHVWRRGLNPKAP